MTCEISNRDLASTSGQVICTPGAATAPLVKAGSSVKSCDDLLSDVLSTPGAAGSKVLTEFRETRQALSAGPTSPSSINETGVTMNQNLGSVIARLPRGLSTVRAMADNASPAQVVAQLNQSFDDFKTRHNAHMNNTQKAIDDIAARISSGQVGGNVIGPNDPPLDPEYSTTYAAWVRGGNGESELRAANKVGDRAAIQAAMSGGTDTAGGYLAPVEWDRRVRKSLLAVSPMRRLATVVTTSVRAYSTVWSDGAWGSGWVGETAARPNTTNPVLSTLSFPNGEIYANPSVTQQLLDDAEFDIQAWIDSELSDEFSKQESIAFVSGNGANKPQGFLTYVVGGSAETVHPGGALTVVPSGQAAALGDSDSFVDFVYSLPSPYRQNARWLMNSTTAAAIAKLKDGDGNYLWRETYVAGQPPTLLGYAVEIDENMPDIAAGNLPIAFGDFAAGYVINDRIGVRILRDPYTNKPYVQFYATKRVGGGVQDPKAIRLIKIAAS